MPEEQAPPVVAVVVACDPARWFEEGLQALAAQDYPNLDVLVVDAASSEDLTARVAGVLPRAFLLRQSERRGFSAAANEALSAVTGASHLLICHDDVAPAPDAVRRLVEEALRSNAGVVGPKLVDWEAPDRLVQVGLGVDRYGAAIERVERGELDQGQHDEVREAFAVPGACMLVRFDLFEALGGFDPDIELFGEDVDLCWRALVAGARVVVAPSARVRHLEAVRSNMRVVGDEAAWRPRHELRTVLKNYDWPRRWLVGTQLLVKSIAQMVVAFVRGDRDRSKRLRAAWRWNLRHRTSLRAARKALGGTRQQPDRAVVRLLSRRRRRPAPVSGPVGPQAGADGDPDEAPMPRTGVRQYGTGPPGHLGWAMAVVFLVVLFGVRNLVFGRLPLVGELLPFPGATGLLHQFFAGWQDAGWQPTGPAPPGFGLVGLAGVVLVGSTAQVEKVLLLGPILVGAVGMYRLLRPLGSGRARLAAAIAYLSLPLAWNGIAAGDLQALVAFAGMPFVLARLCRASRLSPFGPVDEDLRGWRALVADVVPLGLLLALMGALAPASVVAVVALALGLVLGFIAAGRFAAVLRAVAVALGGLAVAFVCCLPWSVTFVQRGARWSVLAGTVSAPGSTPGIMRLLRFSVGPVGAGWLGWGLVVGAGFVLLVGRDVRLDWATRWWAAAVAVVGVAYLGATGRLGAGGGATLVLLAPAACCLAAAVGLGVAAFEVDLARSRFGWRQNLSAGAALCLVAGLMPTLVSTVDGRSSLPSVGYDQLLGWTAQRPAAAGYDVLWLGDPSDVPSPGWQIERGLAFAVSVNGLPDGRRLWPSANPGVGSQVEAAVLQAEAGLTVRLGTSLARGGIRYVIVPEAVAPSLPGVQAPPSTPAPAGLVQTLQAQSDLRQLPTEGGVLVFSNTAWPPAGSSRASSVVSLPKSRGESPGWLRALGLAGGLLVVGLGLGEGIVRRSRRRSRSEAAPGTPGNAAASEGRPSKGGRATPADRGPLADAVVRSETAPEPAASTPR